MTERRLVTFEAPIRSGEFWYSDAEAWSRWLDRVEELVADSDAWALLVERPDMDMVVVDVLDGWRDRVKKFNGRAVRLLRPDGWES